MSALRTSRHNLMEHATFSLQKPKIWNAKSDWSPEILVNARQPIRSGVILTLSLLERPKPALVILLCLAPDNFTCQGRASGGKGLTGSICPSLFLNPFSLRMAPLLFTGWERVKIKSTSYQSRYKMDMYKILKSLDSYKFFQNCLLP